MEKEKRGFVINQLALQKAQLEITLMEVQFENQSLRQTVARLSSVPKSDTKEEK